MIGRTRPRATGEFFGFASIFFILAMKQIMPHHKYTGHGHQLGLFGVSIHDKTDRDFAAIHTLCSRRPCFSVVSLVLSLSVGSLVADPVSLNLTMDNDPSPRPGRPVRVSWHGNLLLADHGVCRGRHRAGRHHRRVLVGVGAHVHLHRDRGEFEAGADNHSLGAAQSRGVGVVGGRRGGKTGTILVLIAIEIIARRAPGGEDAGGRAGRPPNPEKER